MDCTHLESNVKLLEFINTDSSITKNFDCGECGVKGQNWLCLQCGSVNCGRFMNGHALHHKERADHQLCMSCDDFSVYCYECDDYVSCDLDDETISKIRQSLMEIVKENNDNSIEGENLESSNNKSEDQNSSNASSDGTQPSVNDNVTEPSVPCSNIPGTSSDDTQISDKKGAKSSKNIEEPVRSLRSRSRKRSHSQENNASENGTNRSNKEKKCNGKTQKEKKIVGLKNLGNTCFMNAVLQSLNNIQEFSCYFSQLPSLEMTTNGRKVYHSRSYTRQEVHEVIMAEELRKVLINLNTGGCGSKGAISPECLFLVIWKVVPRFRGYQQQDAHEFLRYMLDRLHTELQQLRPREGRAAASIVTAVFGGTLQSEVRCLACGARSRKLDPFLDLSLELPDAARLDAPASLAHCLASFVQVEELADTERYFCSSCKCKQKSTKQFWIRRLPNVLCLHLKRFRWHNYFRTKVDTRVAFPLRALDMSRYAAAHAPPAPAASPPAPAPAPSDLYDLAAVIVHHGSGAGSGHYTAFAINEEQWFHFNDQTVRAADAAAVAACKPYILFYIRRELHLLS